MGVIIIKTLKLIQHHGDDVFTMYFSGNDMGFLQLKEICNSFDHFKMPYRLVKILEPSDQNEIVGKDFVCHERNGCRGLDLSAEKKNKYKTKAIDMISDGSRFWTLGSIQKLAGQKGYSTSILAMF